MQVSSKSPPCGPVPGTSTSPGVACSLWPSFGFLGDLISGSKSLSGISWSYLQFQNFHIHDLIDHYQLVR